MKFETKLSIGIVIVLVIFAGFMWLVVSPLLAQNQAEKNKEFDTKYKPICENAGGLYLEEPGFFPAEK